MHNLDSDTIIINFNVSSFFIHFIPMRQTLCTFLFLIITGVSGFSQNYQCLQTGVKHYFTNSNGYVRGIRIDSVHSYPDSLIYYPFHTLRGSYSGTMGIIPTDSNGGSWLGKKVIQLNDGTFLFDNIWHDTIIIKTQAEIGDSWIFYQDTSNVYYKAFMMSKTVKSIGSVHDSVKTMVIRAFDRDTGYVPSDPASELIIAVSKNFGFYQAFDLYLFPHRYVCPTSYCDTATGLVNDYFFQLCTEQQFSFVETPHIQNENLYEYNVGDIFEYHVYCSGTGICQKYILDTIFSKTVTSSTETEYEIHERGYLQSGYPTTYSVSYAIKNLTVTAGDFDFLNPTFMPEELGIDSKYTYFQNDSSCGFVSPLFTIVSGELFNDFQPCGSSSTYKVGFGQKQNYECHDPTPGNSTSSRMIYSFKNGVSCGTFKYLPTEVNDILLSTDAVTLFPNPANNNLTIRTGKPGKYTVSLTNVSGQQVLANEYDGADIVLDISTLASGFYFVSIADTRGQRIYSKLQINH